MCACCYLTANLASILTTSATTYKVNSFEDAVEQGYTICVPAAVWHEAHHLYPEARFLAILDPLNMFRFIHNDTCQAMLAYPAYGYKPGNALKYGGDANAYDCAAVDAGEVSEEDANCVRNGDGDPIKTRDCNIVRVGGTVISIPLAVPIRKDLTQSFAWVRHTPYCNADQFERRLVRNIHSPSDCMSQCEDTCPASHLAECALELD